MNFISNYTFSKNNRKSILILILTFTIFYSLYNLPITNLIVNYDLLEGPFDYFSPFTLNLFNMDPSLYSSFNNATILHPLTSYIAIIYNSFFRYPLFMLYAMTIFQAFVGSLSVTFMFIFLKNLNISSKFTYIITIFFGVFSYSIISSLVPDSYLYAQLILIVSLVYIQYSLKYNKCGIVGYAILGILNFGITITNIIPYICNVFIANITSKTRKENFKKIFKAILLALSSIAILNLIQYLITDRVWFLSAGDTLEYQYAYTAPIKSVSIKNLIYGFVSSPILLGPLTFHKDLMALCTNFSVPFPIYTKIITMILLLLCIISIIVNIKKKETWFCLTSIFLAIFLHIIIGFGLSTFNYDVYLYAGHYLFTIPILIGLLCERFNNVKSIYKNIFFAFLCCITFIILAHNIFMHFTLLDILKLNLLA